MKKGLCLFIFSVLLACLCLAGTTLLAYAAPVQVTLPTSTVALTISTHHGGSRDYYHRPAWWGRFPQRGSAAQEINQFHEGNSNYNNLINPVGHDQGNTGNHGYNRGHNQDNSLNGGNQLAQLQRLRGYRRINQYSYGNSNYNNRIISQGYNQSNSGNNGLNDGFNQDDSSNSGNQISN